MLLTHHVITSPVICSTSPSFAQGGTTSQTVTVVSNFLSLNFYQLVVGRKFATSPIDLLPGLTHDFGALRHPHHALGAVACDTESRKHRRRLRRRRGRFEGMRARQRGRRKRRRASRMPDSLPRHAILKWCRVTHDGDADAPSTVASGEVSCILGAGAF